MRLLIKNNKIRLTCDCLSNVYRHFNVQDPQDYYCKEGCRYLDGGGSEDLDVDTGWKNTLL